MLKKKKIFVAFDLLFFSLNEQRRFHRVDLLADCLFSRFVNRFRFDNKTTKKLDRKVQFGRAGRSSTSRCARRSFGKIF